MRGSHWSSDRERRRPVLQTDAAAQSVVMARLSVPSAAAKATEVARLYAQAKPQKTDAELAQEELMREAELAHRAARRAWVFERRTGQKPRATDIEYAEIIED